MNYKNLTLAGSSAPHIRTGYGMGQMMSAVIVALLPALGFAVYNFGPRPAVNALVSAAGCYAFETIFRLLRRQGPGDLSAVVTGLLLALLCPPAVPYQLLLLGDFIAIIIVKQLFGGLGQNILNPALTARTVLLLWGGEMHAWTAPHASLPLWGAVDAALQPTPLELLRANDMAGLRELYSIPEVLVGLTSGEAGEVSALLLMLGGLFLIVRGVISWRIPASMLGTAAALTFVFSWGNGRTEWMLYQLFSGSLMLAAFFLATDPVTSPISPAGQLLYGAGCGFFTALLRYYGFCPEGAGFAVLLMNAAGRPLDSFLLTGRVEKPAPPRLPEIFRRKKRE